MPCDAELPSGGNAVNVVVMAALAIGTVVSFIPQWISIAWARSCLGVSSLTIFFMNVSNYFNAVGVLLENWHVVECCQSTYGFKICNVELLPVFLVGANVIGSLPIFLLVVAFFQADETLPGDTQAQKNAVGRRRAVFQLAAFAVLFVITAGLAALLIWKLGESAQGVRVYSTVLDVLSSAGMVIMWLPQIIHTFRLKDPGNLSILTLLIQVPGSAAVVVSMILDKQDWVETLPFIATFVCISVLLVECLVFLYRNRKKSRVEVFNVEEKEHLIVNQDR